MTKNKVVFIDWSVFLHRAIFAWRHNKQVPATYTAMNMIFSCLKCVGLERGDSVIFAMDSPLGSWRKQIDRDYKSNRKVFRAQFDDVDWPKMFQEMDRTLDAVVLATPFEKVRVDYLEADDIISVGSRHYSDRECVIISSDSDYEQLLVYPHVKLFSPLTKNYKFVKNPYRVLLKKIKREAADNLTSPLLTKVDFENRKKIVDLMHLPKEIEDKVDGVFVFPEREIFPERFPFKFLKSRLNDIYNPKFKITVEDSLKREERKKKKAKKKCRKTGRVTNVVSQPTIPQAG